MNNTLSRHLVRGAFVISLLFSHSAAHAALNVLACEPEWAALANQLGGKLVKVHSATTAFQDPHHIQARPGLIAKARKADLLICSGAELEIGWLPILLQKSGNPDIQSGATGHIMTTDYVDMLGKIEKVTKSMGHVHAAGNPHIHLEPQRMLKVANAVLKRLVKLDRANGPEYIKNYEQFQTELTATLEGLQPEIAKLKGKNWIVHHDNWIYLNEWLGLNQVATLEPKAGVPPTVKHLSSLISTVSEQSVSGIAYGSYQPKKAANWLSKKTSVAAIAMPYSIVDWQESGSISRFYESLVKTLTQGFKL